MVKAVSFFGNDLAGTQYRDSKEILGNMPQLYDKSMAFLKANLHNVQEEGASFNTLGKLEIAEEVLEEVVQNALVHRDLLRPAPIRLFVFDNRVEVISPGALAGGLTEEDIRNGKHINVIHIWPPLPPMPYIIKVLGLVLCVFLPNIRRYS